jgi:hypothetical protein
MAKSITIGVGMKKHQEVQIRNVILGIGLLSTLSISNSLAEELGQAANSIFAKLKLPPQQPAAPLMPQGPGLVLPSELMAPAEASIPQGPMPTMPPGPPPVVPPEFMPAPSPTSASANIPEAPEFSQPPTVTLDADGSGIPPNNLGLEAPTETENQSTDAGNASGAS